MSTPVFWLEPTDQVRVRLRRYRDTEDPCPQGGYCDASVIIADRAPASVWVEERVDEERDRPVYRTRDELVARDDARWPTSCSRCGRDFINDDRKQVWADDLYTGAPSGELVTLRDAPPGSAYDAWWLPEWYRGPDGIALMVVLPNGHPWHVDGQASNCTRPQQERRGRTVVTPRSHYCWIRHGDPRDPQGTRTGQKLHVDKRGDTCAAGAGSIVAGNYHGFLHNGALT